MINVCVDVADGAMKLLWQKRERSEKVVIGSRDDYLQSLTNYESEAETTL
jgi:hypothetical protein